MRPRRVGFGPIAALARTGPRQIRLSSHFLSERLRVRQTTRANRVAPVRFTRKSRLSIVPSSGKRNGVRAMNFVQHLKAGSVAEATNDFASGENNDQLLDHYLRVELCPCCGAPAADAKRRVASSPPAETLTADRHGAFVSG